ncbi:hypothetical protein [Streptomyces sp. UNOB3_S3]|uniref:hypothetical protein n=1 Tax=Streptomyces sp. UNOB3_S3 TaxID=2871682 RepID=UPI001E50EBB3|nr:hypothetical protein [Streptomyces sp. UNOB3_S3]MCC3773285.1 hypothetical protein [Streptomyces sp. UNOB3_S3]
MRSKIVSVLMAGSVCLLATACGSEEPSGKDRGSAKAMPSATVLPQRLEKPPTLPDEQLQPSPAADAPFSENLAYELRRKTRDMARAVGSITAECPKDLESKSGARVTCKTAFEGLEVEWDVSIGEKSAFSRNYVTFTATPRQGILTRDGVARLLYGNYRDSIDYALCNDIPKAVLVPLDTQSKYACEVVSKGKKPVGYPQPVRATDSGPRYY